MDEDILHDFLGRFPALQRLIGDVKQQPGVPVVEAPKRDLISAYDRGDQELILTKRIVGANSRQPETRFAPLWGRRQAVRCYRHRTIGDVIERPPDAGG